jgi:uncharacterized protein YeaO (DUF488 family)
VKKTDYATLDFFDVWLPELAPSAGVVSEALSEPFTPKRWAAFVRSYHREMREPSAARLILMLAALSTQTDFAVGCYCADESHCHRSLLRELLAEHGATIADSFPTTASDRDET